MPEDEPTLKRRKRTVLFTARNSAVAEFADEAYEMESGRLELKSIKGKPVKKPKVASPPPCSPSSASSLPGNRPDSSDSLDRLDVELSDRGTSI